jgi:hypothetical protein
MIRIITNLSDTSEIPILPGLEVEVLSDPSIKNKVIALRYDSRRTLLEAFKVINLQQRIIDGQLAKVIIMEPYKNVA